MGVTHEETAEEHKAEGNQRYKEGKLEDACRSYEAAMQLESGLAVYPSNKSACLFELGRYDECVEETRKALSLLSGKEGEESQAEISMRVKLWRRLALALLYEVYSTPERDVCGKAAEIRDLISKVEAVEGVGKDARLSEVAQLLAYHERQGQAAAKPAAAKNAPSEEAHEGEGEVATGGRDGSIPRDTLPRFRPSICTHAREYYAVGHDVPVSGLRGSYELERDEERGLVDLVFSDKGDLDPLARPKGERNVSLLFGGCGDARHFYATLADVWRRLDNHCELGENMFAGEESEGEKREKEEGSPELNLHVTLNDIKTESVARSVLMLLELKNLNKAFKEAASKHEPKDDKPFTTMQAVKESPVLRMLVAHMARIYCGACITNVDDQILQKALTVLIKIEDVRAVLPFVRLRGGQKQWHKMQDVYRSWMSLREEVSVETAYECYSEANSGRRVYLSAFTTGAVDKSGRIHEKIERQRELHDMMTQQIESWSDEKVKGARDHWDEGMTIKDMREELLQAVERANVLDLDLAATYLVASPDITRHGQIGLLHFRGEGRPPPSWGSDPLKWWKAWRPNVTLLAEDWMQDNGTGDALNFQHHSFETLLALSKGAVPYAEIHTRLPALHMAACFFLGAARGLHYLTTTDGSALGSLTVELSIGDVHAMFDQQDEEEGHEALPSLAAEGTQGGAALPPPPPTQAMPPPPPSASQSASTASGASTSASPHIGPRRFDRISISNICDYTTLLPSFLTLLPTLKPAAPETAKDGKERTQCTLNHNILLARGMYNNLEDYVKQTVGVGTMGQDECAALLGARHCGGELWEGHIHWANARPSAQQRQRAMKQVESWLRKLFATICLPPPRSPIQISTEHKPLTLRLLFDVLLHLCRLGYPPHSLSLLLASLLARPPSPPSTNLMSLCQTELRALASIYAPLLPFPLPPLLLTAEHGPTRKYRISIHGVEGLMTMAGAKLFPVLGAMLIRNGRGDGGKGRRIHEEESERESGSDKECDEEEGNTKDEDDEGWGQDVRPFLERREGVRLLSVIGWDSERCRLTFIMGQRELENLVGEGGWSVRLWRSDGYSFESSAVPLRRAKRVKRR